MAEARRWKPKKEEPKEHKAPETHGRLTAHTREAMPKSDFALPGHGEGPKGAGAGSYPIPDESHARNALARVAQHGTAEEKARVRAAVHRKFPNIGADKKTKRRTMYDSKK
jgi:hypothetical protein